MSTFDSGFSHRFPGKEHLLEDLIDGQRTLIDRDAHHLSESQAALTLPFERVGEYVYYTVPNDSRDLGSLIRLIKKPAVAMQIGSLLGIRLNAIDKSFGGVPQYSILNRIAAFSSNAPNYPKKFGGIDMRLLPPFKDLGAPIAQTDAILGADILCLGMSEEEIGLRFQEAVLEGLHHVG